MTKSGHLSAKRSQKCVHFISPYSSAKVLTFCWQLNPAARGDFMTQMGLILDQKAKIRSILRFHAVMGLLPGCSGRFCPFWPFCLCSGPFCPFWRLSRVLAVLGSLTALSGQVLRVGRVLGPGSRTSEAVATRLQCPLARPDSGRPRSRVPRSQGRGRGPGTCPDVSPGIRGRIKGSASTCGVGAPGQTLRDSRGPHHVPAGSRVAPGPSYPACVGPGHIRAPPIRTRRLGALPPPVLKTVIGPASTQGPRSRALGTHTRACGEGAPSPLIISKPGPGLRDQGRAALVSQHPLCGVGAPSPLLIIDRPLLGTGRGRAAARPPASCVGRATYLLKN